MRCVAPEKTFWDGPRLHTEGGGVWVYGYVCFYLGYALLLS